MRIAKWAAVIGLIVPAAALADSVTYYASGRFQGIFAIPSNGPATTISNPYGASGFTRDSVGNFIVANAGVLVKVTPQGNATVIANAPALVGWVDVTLDGNGNYVLTDNGTHKIFRVSASTFGITPVATYPTTADELEDSYVRVDASGNYIVVSDNGPAVRVFRITPAGVVSEIHLSGVIPTSVGGMTFDASGNYVITDFRHGAIDVITPSGTVTTLIQNDTLFAAEILGVVRDSSTGNFVVAGRLSNSLYLVAPDGSSFNQFFSGAPLSAPEDLVEAGDTASTPAPAGVTPASGSGTTATFTLTYSDTGGWQNLAIVNVLFNNVLDGRHACYVAYAPTGRTSGTVYLVDNGGDSAGPFSYTTLPGSGTASNGQCSISGTLSSASGSGTTLTLMLNVTFTSAFAGNQVIYMAARESVANSGWQPLGTWNVPGSTPSGPSVTSLTPGRTTSSTQTYTLTFTDTLGWQDIGVANVLVNGAIDGRNACYIAYVPAGAAIGLLDLVDNAGDGGGSFAGAFVLPASGTASNSQCAINGAGSSASASGGTLTLTLSITFNHSFTGNQVIYAAVRSNTQNSGWQAVGSVAVP